jgi:hypothetical protein
MPTDYTVVTGPSRRTPGLILLTRDVVALFGTLKRLGHSKKTGARVMKPSEPRPSASKK